MLSDTRVITVTGFLAGPLAARILSDMGAEVIKVENPDGGDPYRYLNHHYDEDIPEDMTYRFLQYNRGKQSIALDLTSDEGSEVFESLLKDADVLIQNLGPGAMESFGFGPDRVREINDEIVNCAISGYGATGPFQDRSAMDGIIQAMSGLIDQNAADAGHPVYTGIFLADIVGGLYAATSVLGVLASNVDGEYIDLSLLDALVSLLNHEAAEYSSQGTAPPRIRSSIIPHGVFETADGALAINLRNANWPTFCEILGFSDWATSGKFSDPDTRQEHREEVVARVRDRLTDRPTDNWLDPMLDAGLLVAPVVSVDEAFEHEQLLHRNMIEQANHEAVGDIVQLPYPGIFTNASVGTSDGAPQLGEDSTTVLRELGYDDDAIAALRATEVVKSTD